MKYFILTYIYLYSYACTAQLKFDYNWILGRPNTPPEDSVGVYGGTWVDFNYTPLQYKRISINVDIEANATISDSSGNLLFYTDGCSIVNRTHAIMKNGKGINEGGAAYQQGCLENSFGYPAHQGVAILPFPGYLNQYILIHLRKPDPLSRAYVEDILYSKIDMNGDSGLGIVTEKNKMIYHDTFCDMLTAVRHGNGRDWWLVLPHYEAGEYFVFLVSPEGVSGPQIQRIGDPIQEYGQGVQAVFSPDGTKYANNTRSAGLQIFDFDRCTGTLSHPVHIGFPGDTVFACGVAISSTSRYLYASNTGKLYQFDLHATRNVEASRELVGVYDRFENPLPTTFYQMMLAPDGKIYMTSTSGTNYWHIIHSPDKKGIACDLEQHFELPTVHSFSPPNFPHFRLFDQPGSPCDTLGIDGPPPPQDTTPPLPNCAGSVRVYPNPAAGFTWVELPGCQGGALAVFDVAGRRVEELGLDAMEVRTRLDVSGWGAGIYLLRIRAADGTMTVRTLAVLR